MVSKQIWMAFGGVALASVLALSASAQQVISVQPMITTMPSTSVISSNQYYCAKCGQYHSRPGAGASSVSAPASSSHRGLSAGGGVRNVLAALNAQRAQQGVGSLASDGQLQAVAQQRAQLMASTGTKTHPPGSYAPGRYEGVGWSSSYSPSAVSACFTSDPSMRVAGAAMATGRDGVYFCVVYR